jgi:hypothetical protein
MQFVRSPIDVSTTPSAKRCDSQTGMDGPIRYSSLTLKRNERLKTDYTEDSLTELQCYSESIVGEWVRPDFN